MMNTRMHFLRMFDPSAPAEGTPQNQGAGTPVAQPPPAAPAVSPEQLAEANLRQALAEQARIRAAAATIQVQEPVVAAPPSPVPPASAQTPNEEILKEIQRLNRKIDEERRARVRAETEAYRQNAIGQARAAGRELLDGYVTGNTPDEIMASIEVACREYDLVAARVLARAQQQQPPQQVAQPPVGTVTQQAPPQQQAISAPTAPNGASAPNEPSGYTPEMIKYLTSTACPPQIYAQHRHALMMQLRGANPYPAGMPGTQPGWSFGQSYQLAPALPQPVPGPFHHAPAMPPQPLPAPGSVYAGVTLPNVNPQNGTIGRAAPVGHQFAPQPADLQREIAQGQYAAIPGAAYDPNAARAAAEAAIVAQRPQYAGGGGIHKSN